MNKNLLIITIMALLLSGCASKDSENDRAVVSGVKTQIIAKTIVDDFYQTSATVKPITSSVVSSMIMGRVTGLNVQEGDYVTKGQVLLTIDSRDTAQRALGAKAGVNEASKGAEQANQSRKMENKTYQRYKKLYDEKRGLYGLSKEERIENARKAVKKEGQKQKNLVLVFLLFHQKKFKKEIKRMLFKDGNVLKLVL
jgi:multidrug efflux pump subunit AcrA (membrane-fusion protein)